jgi:hypothetical protein
MPVGDLIYLIVLVCVGGIGAIVTGVAVYLIGNKFKLLKAILATMGSFFLLLIAFDFPDLCLLLWIPAIVAGVIVYLFGNRFRLVEVILAAAGGFFLIFLMGLVPPGLVGTLQDIKRGAWMTFEAAELVGTWEATYEEVGPHHVSGVEILTLRADGTYQQIFRGEGGYVYTSPWYKWWLEDRRVIHLERGRFYPEGIIWAEWLGRGDAIVYTHDWRGREIRLDGTEIVLYVWLDSDAPGGVILEHLPVGDPDAPDYVQFHRVSKRVPVSTSVP